MDTKAALAVEAAARDTIAAYEANEQLQAAIRRGRAQLRAAADRARVAVPHNPHDPCPLIPLPPRPLAVRQAEYRRALVARRRAIRAHRYAAGADRLPPIPGHAYAATGDQVLTPEAAQWARQADYTTRDRLRLQIPTYSPANLEGIPRPLGYYPRPLPCQDRPEWIAPAPAAPAKAKRAVSLATARKRCEAAVAGYEAGNPHGDYRPEAIYARLQTYAAILPVAEYDAYHDRIEAVQEAVYVNRCAIWLQAEAEYRQANQIAPVIVQACPEAGCTLGAGHISGHLIPV